jgi:hypothetical protein
MAAEQQLLNYGLLAGADLRGKEFCAGTVGSDGRVVIATEAKNMDGVLQQGAQTNDACTIGLFGVSKAKAGGTGYAAGDLLEVTADGAFQTKASGTAVAKALTAAAADCWGSVIILKSVAAYS